MGLSRKREKELKKLRGNTETLWQAHHEVLNRAKSVLREAKKQATQLAHDEVAPRVRLAVDQHVKPRVGRSARATQSVASSCHKKFVGDVLPSVAAVIGSTLSVIDLARSGRTRSDAGSPSKTRGENKGRDMAPPSSRTPQSAGSRAGGPIALIFGVIAAAGVGFALWQTFRADDELWVTDDYPARNDLT